MNKYIILIILFFLCSPAYAKPLNEMSANTNPDITNDLIYSQDVSDTTEASTGTGKSLTIKNALKAAKINVDGTNVGINTVGPTQQLEVIGTVKATAFVGDGSGLTNISGGGGGGSVTINTTSPLTGGGTGSSFTLGVDQSLLSLSSIGGSVTDSQVPNNITIDLSSTATALASNPSACPSGEFVSDISADGTLTCSTPSSSSGGWTDSGTTVNPTTSTDSVGIGTTSAIGRLTIKGQNVHYVGCSDSISTAITNASSGDTLELGSCTYTVSSSFAINKSLTIRGKGPASTILDSGSTATGFFTISASNVSIENMKITGTNVSTAISATGSGTNLTNVYYRNIIIDVSRSSGGSNGVTNTNTSGGAENITIFNTTGSGSSSDQNRSFSVFGNSSCSGDITFYVKDAYVYSKTTSSSWDGGRIRGYMLWNNNASVCGYDMKLYLSNSVGLAEFPESTASYGTEAINCQGPNSARSYGTVGGHYCYIYNTVLDGGVADGIVSTGSKDIRCDDYSQCYLQNVTLRRHAIQNQNSATIYRLGSVNAAGVFSAYSEVADIYANGAPGISTLGQDAGEEGQAGVRTGKTGGYNLLRGGTGGAATGTDAAKTGGSGGYGSIVGGAGADQTEAAPTNNGGDGGYIGLTGGIGGDATGGTANNGGDGGDIFIRGGVPGTGATTNGDSGNVYLGVDSSGERYGNVGIGTTTAPGSKLSVFGGVSMGSSTYSRTAAPSNGLIVSGNVGLGTINPTQKLHVVGNALISGLTSGECVQASTGGLLTTTGSACGSGGGGGGWTDGGADVYLTTSSDNVGIGTTITYSKLDVGYGQVAKVATGTLQGAFGSNSNNINGIEMQNKSAGTSAEYRFSLVDDGSLNYLSVSMPGSGNTASLFGNTRSGIASIFTNGIGAGTGRILAFGTVKANDVIFGTNNAENMRIVSGGNVGIGTVNPLAKLQVGGDARVGNGTFSNTSSNEDLYVEGNLEVDGSLFGSGTGPMTITNANVGIGTVTAGSLLTVGSTGQFTVDTSGNTRVGIGTTTAGTIVCVKSISSSTAVLGYCTGSLTNSICGTCN